MSAFLFYTSLYSIVVSYMIKNKGKSRNLSKLGILTYESGKLKTYSDKRMAINRYIAKQRMIYNVKFR